MSLLHKLWDDVVAGPQPERGLGKLRDITTKPKGEESSGGSAAATYQRSLSMPAGQSGSGPGTPTTPSATSVTPNSSNSKENVWRSVFHPGRNLATKTIGANIFDKPQPNSPTVYDWMYSGESKSNHR